MSTSTTKIDYCAFCDAKTPHNKCKPTDPKNTDWRCTSCGRPLRPGRKNWMAKRVPGGKVEAIPQT